MCEDRTTTMTIHPTPTVESINGAASTLRVLLIVRARNHLRAPLIWKRLSVCRGSKLANTEVVSELGYLGGLSARFALFLLFVCSFVFVCVCFVRGIPVALLCGSICCAWVVCRARLCIGKTILGIGLRLSGLYIRSEMKRRFLIPKESMTDKKESFLSFFFVAGETETEFDLDILAHIGHFAMERYPSPTSSRLGSLVANISFFMCFV